MKRKRTIYVVFGATGEYSDHNEWAVCGYAAEGAAKAHVALATEYAKAFEARFPYFGPRFQERMDALKGANPYDPNMTIDYTGINYYVVPVEILDAVPPRPSSTVDDGARGEESGQAPAPEPKEEP